MDPHSKQVRPEAWGDDPFTESILEAVPTALLLVDRAGRIQRVNELTGRLFGWPREKLLGQAVEVLVPAGLREQHPGQRDRYLAQPVARAMGSGRELFGQHRDGSEFPVEIGLNPVLSGGNVHVLAAIVDITERKRLEANLVAHTHELEQRGAELERSNEALERSNVELQQFAYVASHDLLSPLRAISGFVQLIQHSADLDPSNKERMARVVSGVSRLGTLIKDLLDYSRLDTRARPFETVKLEPVLRQVLELLEVQIEESGAQITHGALADVEGDAAQLRQLLHNLIENAIKYRGDVPPEIRVEAREEKDCVRLAVVDNGIGVDAAQAEKIFEIFRRLHTQQQYPGTGIGLAVCRRVVTRHAGRIWVESLPGGGCQFLCTLPRAERAAP